MELLTSLGVNSSLAVQFGIFIICYGLLKRVLFDPYFAAFDIRSARTVGTTELAEKYMVEKRELEKQYARRAQESNEQFRQTYDEARRAAVKEYDRVVSDARARGKALVDQTAERVRAEVGAARTQIQTDVTLVSKLISQQLIGKDVHS